jgi:hypothetical protein
MDLSAPPKHIHQLFSLFSSENFCPHPPTHDGTRISHLGKHSTTELYSQPCSFLSIVPILIFFHTTGHSSDMVPDFFVYIQ